MTGPRWTDQDLSLAAELAYAAGKAAGIREAILIGDEALDAALGGQHAYGYTGPIDPSAVEIVRRFHRAISRAVWSDSERRWDRELSRVEVAP